MHIHSSQALLRLAHAQSDSERGRRPRSDKQLNKGPSSGRDSRLASSGGGAPFWRCSVLKASSRGSAAWLNSVSGSEGATEKAESKWERGSLCVHTCAVFAVAVVLTRLCLRHAVCRTWTIVLLFLNLRRTCFCFLRLPLYVYAMRILPMCGCSTFCGCSVVNAQRRVRFL